jgi:Na+-driven multidrug efflux pump
VPIVLRNLGISDYGLYNVIGGLVVMFSFLGTSLASGTQRYLAFAIGRNDTKLLKETFHTTATIYLIFGVITFIVIEIFGLWFVNYKMVIPEGRSFAANVIFHFSAIAFVINLLSIPYNSALIAHERMNIYAYTSIFDNLAKLLLAFSLKYFVGDKLIFYGLCILMISVSLRVFYQIYCRYQFVECSSFRLTWDRNIGSRLLSYSGWNVVGVLANIGRMQGLNLLLNLFFGTLINAAHSIAIQVNGIMTQFVTNIYMATRPQITKYYANGEVSKMWDLVFQSAKFSYYLLMIVCIPAIIEMHFILNFWLKEVPEYAVYIVDMFLIILMIETTINQIIAAFQAANRIKTFQIISSLILLMCVPLVYIFLRFIRCDVHIPYIISLALSAIYCLSILIIAKKEINLDMGAYLSQVFIPVISLSCISFAVLYPVSRFMEESILRAVFTLVLSTIIQSILIYKWGVNAEERNSLRKILKNKLKGKKDERTSIMG